MKILLVGNDPGEIGGVANYTRPLALEFARLGHDVHYLFSGAWFRKYNWLMRAYFRAGRAGYPFATWELVNSPCWTTNYGRPLLDIHAPAAERVFVKLLDRVRPDVMHVHSRMGLPASFIEIAARRGVRVFATVHVYGLLCQHRVMMDFEGHPCDGPADLERCAVCTGSLDIGNLMLSARVTNTGRFAVWMAVSAKRLLRPSRSERNGVERRDDLTGRAALMRERLGYMVRLLNEHVERTLCVSADVESMLSRYGVSEQRLSVSHIGSTMAAVQRRRNRAPGSPLVIGSIGGVHHYKGTGVLVKAIERLRGTNFVVRIFGKYDPKYVEKLLHGRDRLPVRFLGRYLPEELPGILDQIDVMVLPSICRDTAPQTIFESFSAGVPIIASDIGGFPDFVRPNVNGLLFRAGDPEALALQLQAVVDRPEQLTSLSAGIPKLKTIGENAEELIGLYGANG